MTYCVGLKLKAGLVLLSDTRTNAGVDNVARFRKMFIFEDIVMIGDTVHNFVDGILIGAAFLTNIHLGVVTAIETAVKRAKVDPEVESVMNCESLYRAAQMVGEAMLEIQKRDRAHIEAQGSAADACLGGVGRHPR